jgi:predicted HAD superfamily Cof-like phosphohydrolase
MNIEELVKDWALTFGLPVNEKPTIPNKEEILLAFKLIEEEFLEFRQAIQYQLIDGHTATGAYHITGDIVEMPEDITEIADSLTDTLWTVIRAMQVFGLNPQKCMEAVYESNMSKLCYSYDEIEETVEAYKQKGIEVVVYPAEFKGFIVKNKNTDKVLKSINFKEPKFDL